MKIVCLVYQNILKGDKTASVANYAITAVYYILLFLIGTGTAGTGLLVVGYIYMTVDMVKTELLFRNIKYASMEIIDNSEEVAKKFSDNDKKILGTNIISDNDLNSTIVYKRKRKNKTKRKNKYNEKHVNKIIINIYDNFIFIISTF